MNDRQQDPGQSSADGAELRKRAEEHARSMELTLSAHTPEEMQQVLHDLRVHQIELEMQNEELRTAQVEIQAGRERYFDLYNLAPAGYCTLSEKGLILEANLTLAALLGTTRSTLVRQPISRFIFKDDQDIYYLHRKQLFETGEAQICEMRLVKPDGALFWAHLTGTAAQAEDGTPVCRVALSDITERKLAERELIESEERFRSYIEHSPVGVYIVDEQGNLIDVNRTACTDTGYSREELLRMNLLDLNPPEQREEAQTRFQAIFTDKKLSAEIPFRRKDGSQGSWALNAILLPDHQMLGFAADITEQKSLENQLLQAKKMETVGRLAGGVAHDFNNMLTVILGHLEIVLDELDPSEMIYSDLQAAYKSAERSADLTAQLLAFARKQTVAPVALDLNKTIAGMLKMLERLIGEDTDLLWKPGVDLGLVKMDPSQIDQMLANLCINARDAIRDTGKITIETGSENFDEAYCASHPDFLPGRYVLLAVSDDGCGMDKETFNHLFEPFFTTKGVGEGTGLGLATVYGIVKQNNGFINVCTEPGVGTTFRIYLPQIDSSLEKKKPARTASSKKSGEGTILLVEDEAAILKVTTIMLERMGYNVLPASTPGECIWFAEEYSGQIDLLITDVIMPGMNGRDLANELLSQRPGIKRLFMSGYTANTIAHHGVLDPGVDFIQKPFSIQELSTRVREILSRS
jgi:two-component system, cell cycle sensor histidine kinase and response regulator CckA